MLRDCDAPLVQSMAVIEYLEELHSLPSLLPQAPRAGRVRALAQTIACDIHLLEALRVLRYLEQQFGIDAEGHNSWCRHWSETGFAVLGVCWLTNRTPSVSATTILPRWPPAAWDRRF